MKSESHAGGVAAGMQRAASTIRRWEFVLAALVSSNDGG
jgi:hypothetical protein